MYLDVLPVLLDLMVINEMTGGLYAFADLQVSSHHGPAIISLLLPLALLAIQHLPEVQVAPFFSEHPGPIREWWLMAHMLPVPTGQISHPIAVLILMKAEDALLHQFACVARKASKRDG